MTGSELRGLPRYVPTRADLLDTVTIIAEISGETLTFEMSNPYRFGDSRASRYEGIAQKVDFVGQRIREMGPRATPEAE